MASELPSLPADGSATQSPGAPAAPVCTFFCGPRASPVAHLAASIYRANGIKWPLALWTPRHLADEFTWASHVRGLSLHFDDEVPGFEAVHAFLREHHARGDLGGRSTGWYLQQYLKLAVAWEAKAPLFIHDGDTVFSPRLLAEQARAPFLMTTREGTARYTATAQAMGLPTHPKSFVANGGMFVPEVLQDLGSDPATWFMDMMTHGVFEEDKADFSEYQTMGALLKPRMPVRRIALFRRFDLIAPPDQPNTKRKVLRALKRYDAVAFESGHRAGAVRRLLGRCALGAGYSW